MSNIIIKPIITEKTTKLGDKLNRYAFRVDRNANRLEIKKAIEAAYQVKVEDVNTVILPAKTKVRQTKKGIARGVKPAFKKAYITLGVGQTIDIYGTV
jgi:large subunit ribosomal protein L23